MMRYRKSLKWCKLIMLSLLFLGVFTTTALADITEIGEVVGRYFQDRANDFLDIFRFRLSAAREAKGFGFHIRATCLAQVGALYFDGEHFGMDRRAIGVWREKRFAGGLSAVYFTDVTNDIVYGNRFTDVDDVWSEAQERGIVRNNIYWDDGRNHPFSIGAEVQLGILPGVDIGVYPTELVDFVVGIFTLDPWGDDLMRIEYLRPYPEEVELFEPIQPLHSEEAPEKTPAPMETKTLPEETQ